MDTNRRIAALAAERTRQRAQRQQQRWQDLERLLRQAQGLAIRRLSTDDLLRMGKLYRLAAAELARANSLNPNRPLHRLVGLGYAVLYAQPPLQRLKFWTALWRFLWRDFPAAVVQHVSFVLLAAFALLGSAALTAAILLWRSEIAMAWLGDPMMAVLQEVAQRHRPGHDWLPLMGRPFAFWLILLNNLRVALIGFGFGLAAMLPALYVLFANGKVVGGVLAVSYQFGTFWELLGFITPHGVVELTAFCLAGAAGLAIGYRWLHPGDFTRTMAIVQAGRKAAPLLFGTLLMLLYAAFLEAFFSPHERIPVTAKIAFGAAEGVLLTLYIITRGIRS